MNLRLFFNSNDVGLLDKAITDVVDILRQNSVSIIGPIPLPTGFSSFKPYSGNVTHKRMMDVENPQNYILEILAEVNIPMGVEVEMRYS